MKKLITIHTNGDFWVSYKDEILRQFNQSVFLVFNTEQEFIDAVYNYTIAESSDYTDLLFDMVNNGPGIYGNYSYNIEDYHESFIYDTTKEL